MIEADSKLLANWTRGDGAAFEQLFLRYYGQVLRVLHGVTGRLDEAEDLAQETFLELYRNPPRLGTAGRLAPWLHRVALNRAYNAMRGERRARQRIERAFDPP